MREKPTEPMDYEARARNGKALFDFLANWTAPELPGMAADVVKRHIVFGTQPSALFGNACSVVMSRTIDAVSPEEREALSELAEYRREVYQNSSMLDAGYGRPERVFANLYDALFAHLAIHGERRDKDYDLYRGHLDSRWRLQASYYRKLSDRREARDDRADVISGFFGVHVVPLDDMSAEERARMVVELCRQYPVASLEGLEPLQQEAIIQHYLSGTKLIDFTTSIYVAGFFATTIPGPMAANERPPMGAIYRIAPRELDELPVDSFASIARMVSSSRFDSERRSTNRVCGRDGCFGTPMQRSHFNL
jgi:FRG domain